MPNEREAGSLNFIAPSPPFRDDQAVDAHTTRAPALLVQSRIILQISIPLFSSRNDKIFSAIYFAPFGISDPGLDALSDLRYVPTLRRCLRKNVFLYSGESGPEAPELPAAKKQLDFPRDFFPRFFSAIYPREFSPRIFPAHFPHEFSPEE